MKFLKHKYNFSSLENIKYLEKIYLINKKSSYLLSNNWNNYFKKFNNFFKKKKNKNKNKSKNKNKKKIYKLINYYRNLGFNYSKINPIENYKEIKLKIKKKSIKNNINYTNFSKKNISLKNLINFLNKTYCKYIGIECNYIKNSNELKWIYKKIEKTYTFLNFSKKKRKKILELLINSKTLEEYLHLKYPGQKRFSLEGAEGLIPSLYELIIYASKFKIEKIFLGMSHRGRINILINILGKKIKKLFDEFENKSKIIDDVKYHQGFTTNIQTKYNNIQISLLFNPSHLEIINPVVLGLIKSKSKIKKNLSILIHGDASFFGQGIIMETLNLSKTRGYNVYGTIHIIINNQIGFTTLSKDNIKSVINCTNIAKMIDSPVFHVNSDNVESLIYIFKLALEYKLKFEKDVFINIICYRKLGHNEQDSPTLTQPLMYQKIFKHPNIYKIYKKKLIKKKIINKNFIKKKIDKYISFLNLKKNIFKKKNIQEIKDIKINFLKKKINYSKTSISYKKIYYFARVITTIPKNFKIHLLLKKIINDRKEMALGFTGIDWGMSENILYSSLLDEGYSVRITGQDVSRGTFSHRHIIFHDQNLKKKNKGIYTPLKYINKKSKSNFKIIDSILSEEAVLGFEYGYSINNYKTITIWEAQFGDFSNVAQIIIDQFISSGEKKWNQLSNLILFLPHGYEGQGPEHSSARIERYLQLCANNNIQIIQPTKSFQIFHIIRYQIKKLVFKPLIIFNPKLLLRSKQAKSILFEFTNENFKNIILENNLIINYNLEYNIILCSGKIYYELIIKKNILKKRYFIIRIEKLYPFPKKEILNFLKKFKIIKNIFWVQDEPKNQGPWFFIKNYISKYFNIKYIGRNYNSSTATGNYNTHIKQQKEIIKKLFNK